MYDYQKDIFLNKLFCSYVATLGDKVLRIMLRHFRRLYMQCLSIFKAELTKYYIINRINIKHT